MSHDAMKELEEYRHFVEAIAKASGPSQVILNRSPEHASIVIEMLFRKAINNVQLISRKLSADVYASKGVIDAASQFLARGGKVHFLVETAINRTQHPLLIALDKVARSNVVITVVPEQIASRYKFNLVVADGQSYRFEPDRGVREAIIRFGDQQFGEKLEGAFAQIARDSLELNS